ncbi:unnamed protein product [Cunninghamella blakesleeana]
MSTTKSQDMGFPLYMCVCAAIAAISGLQVGWAISVPNMPNNAISNCTGGDSHGPLPPCLPMSQFTWGYTVGAYPIGGIVGSIISKYSNVYLVRRHNIMITCLLFMFGNVLSAVSINIPMYSIGRAIVGLAAGMCGSSVGIYVSEISTDRSRGALGSLFELFLNTGVLLTQICGLFMSFDPLWRFLWGISAIIALIQLVLLALITVESPRRLCANKDYDAAAAALQKLRAGGDIEEEFAALLAARQRAAENSTPSMSIWDLLSWKDKHITWRTILIMVIQSYNQAGGIGPMSVYSVRIFTEILNDPGMATNLVLINSAVKIVGTVFALMIVRRLGRKRLLLTSLFGCTVGCVLMVIASHDRSLGGLVMAAGILYITSYSLGCGTIPWFIAPEFVPMHALASASALGCTANWTTNFLINILWPYISAGLGDNAFIVFVATNFLGFAFLFVFMPNINGNNLDAEDDDEKTKSAEHQAESGSSNGSDYTEKKEVEHVN